MRPEIELLQELQKLDRRVLQVKQKLQAYPHQIKKLEANLALANKQLNHATADKTRLRKDQHNLELEIKAMEDQLNKYQRQQLEVKTNEEYQALTKEIDHLGQKIDEAETRLLELLDAEDKAAKDNQLRQDKLIELEAKTKQEKEKIQQKMLQQENQLQEINQKRDRLTVDLPPELKEFYDTYGPRYPGNIVVEVKRGSCLGCNMELLPQRLVEVHKGEGIIYCDRCHRILAVDLDYQGQK